MVAPVTGPYTRSQEFAGPPVEGGYKPKWLYKYSMWHRQGKPYDLPLRYRVDVNEVLAVNCPVNQVVRDYSFCDPPDLSHASFVTNRCYSKFAEELNNPSMWAVNQLEFNKTLEGLLKRVTQLTKFTKRLKKGDLIGAARDLGLVDVPKRAKKTWKTKDLASTWLEYHFGWEPLVKDVGAAIEVLTETTCKLRVKANSSDTLVYQDGGPLPSFNIYHHRVRTVVKMQANVQVDNPNLHLASQLGFVNPLSIAWELVPFSFVLDWFSNVGQVLGALTDFAGVSFTGAFTTVYQVIDKVERGYGNWDVSPFHQNLTAVYRSTYINRYPEISTPVLNIRPFRGFSPVRGATAVALLIQQLKR